MRDCPVIGGLADGRKRDHLTETEHHQSNWNHREGANMGCKQLKRLLSIADWRPFLVRRLLFESIDRLFTEGQKSRTELCTTLLRNKVVPVWVVSTVEAEEI